MADLAATDVTVTISNRDKNIFGPPPAKKAVIAQLEFGDGSKLYPSGGVPLPAKEQFGFKREVAFGRIEDAPGDGFVYKYDRSNHKIRIYTMGIVTDATGGSVLNNDTQCYYIENSASALSASLLIMGASAADTIYDMGPLIELPTTVAPSSTTLRILLIGE
jgi:hypothetical protein